MAKHRGHSRTMYRMVKHTCAQQNKVQKGKTHRYSKAKEQNAKTQRYRKLKYRMGEHRQCTAKIQDGKIQRHSRS